MASRTCLSEERVTVQSYRPELGPHPLHHEYSQQFAKADVCKLHHLFAQCDNAINLEWNLEKRLFESGFLQKNNPFLIVLEKSLLDLCSRPSICHGVFYYVCFPLASKVIVRYVEGGCYDGFMHASGLPAIGKSLNVPVENLLPWRVYTQQDVADREQHYNDRSSVSGQGRQRQIYNRLLGGQTTSVKKQLQLLKMKIEQTTEVTVCNFAVHVLKCAANPSKPDDRYLHVFPASDAASAEWQSTLHVFAFNGEAAPRVTNTKDLVNMSAPTTLIEQFELLSSISNLHWWCYPCLDGKPSTTSSHVGLLQHLAFQLIDADSGYTSYYPTSLRNRMIFFHMYGWPEHMQQLLYYCLHDSPVSDDPPTVESHETNCPEPPRKSRRCFPRKLKVTPDMLQSEFALPAHVTDVCTANLPAMTIYQQFCEKLVMEGTLLWRMHTDTVDVVVMNDFSAVTGCFQPNSFVHVSMLSSSDEQQFICTCQTYAHLQHIGLSSEANDEIVDTVDNVVVDAGGSITCMHCRFFREYIATYVAGGPFGSDKISLKFQQGLEMRNNGVVILGSDDQQNVKLSVRSTCNEDVFAGCCIVCLTGDGSYVTCKSGKCQVLMHNKKKTANLLLLTNTTSVCTHLQTLHANSEQWKHLVPSEDCQSFPQSSDRNVEDGNLLTDEKPGKHFDVTTGLWNFGGLSKSQPYQELDLHLSTCIQRRQTVHDLSPQHVRNASGFLTNYNLVPPLPTNCACGVGFTSTDFPFGSPPVHDFTVKLYCRHAPIWCDVYNRYCLGASRCIQQYSGHTDGIHFWSKEVAAADEIGWDFCARVMNSKTSFSAFCTDITRQYQTTNVQSAPFMSRSTFVSWFFSWAAAMKIDFRSEVDPWCKHSPKILAGDGTHIGMSIRNLRQVRPLEEPDLPDLQTANHKRYDRVFLPYREDVPDDLVRKARVHLRYLSNRYLGMIDNDSELDDATLTASNQVLLQSAPNVPSVQLVLDHFASGIYPTALLQSIAILMRLLASDAPVLTVLPWRFHESVLSCCAALKISDTASADLNCLHTMSTYAPEVAAVCKASLNANSQCEIASFLEYLVQFTRSIHAGDVPFDEGEAIAGSYNPESGICYYFTEHGCQLREIPTYCVTSTRSNFDDVPMMDDTCLKKFPCVSRGGFAYSFLWFCPIHGHCYGFHTIAGSEGRKDPFFSLLRYLAQPPEELFYDFACGFSEYALNRAPGFFKQTRFWHDIFHGYSHKCATSFNSSRLGSLLMVNSEICEQFNSFIQCIKYTGTHLSQSHFCFFMQFFIYIWNRKKTQSFLMKRHVALAGMQ